MIDRNLYVWIYLPVAEKPVPCGILSLLPGNRKASFRYLTEYVNNPGAFALSPDLPLREIEFMPPQEDALHPVFDDAGPDKWGRRVIDREENPSRRSEIDYLWYSGEDRVGALAFSSSAERYEPHSMSNAFHTDQLSDLLEAARCLELNLPLDDKFRRLLKQGTSLGGMRPKTILEHNGQAWIAKFPSIEDTFDVCAMEHASLELARKCGIIAPESRLVSVGKMRVLLVERFDRVPGGRIPYLSARSMMIAEGYKKDEFSYSALAEITRRYSREPKQDCLQLFRRMVFNILLDNTDDHEKNHGFLYDGSSWNLAPAFDVSPQLQGLGYQQMNAGRDGMTSSMGNALSECEIFGLSKMEACRECEVILEKMRLWQEIFAHAGVSQEDIEKASRFVLREGIRALPKEEPSRKKPRASFPIRP